MSILSQVSCGGTHSVALTCDGRIFSVCNNSNGMIVQSYIRTSILDLSLFCYKNVHYLEHPWYLDDYLHLLKWLICLACWQFGRGDHGRLGYGRKVTTGQPMEVPINIPPPKDTSESTAKGHWTAKLIACGGRHTLALVEWQTDESKQWFMSSC